jgi:hypothetical protein
VNSISITDFSKHSNYERIYNHKKRDICYAWLKQYIDIFCEKSPNAKEVHLPSVLKKIELYDLFIYDMTINHGYSNFNNELPLISHFLKTWRIDFPLLKKPRNSRLGKCSFCTKMLNKRPSFVSDALLWKQLVREHVTRVNNEKKNYYCRRLQAQSFPHTYGSIIIDWATPHKFPHNATSVKSWLLLKNIKFDLCGIINHGLREKFFYPFLPLYKYTCDVNISLIHHQLTYWKKKHSLPPILNVQADNCSSENKNRYILGYFQLLIERKWFKEIYLNFLPVGHTHEDIDAFFQSLST